MLEAPSIGRRVPGIPPLALVLVTGAFAVCLGAAVGNPSVQAMLLIAGVVAIALVTFIVRRPFAGFLVLTVSSTILAVVAVTSDRYLNAFDVILPTLVLLAVFGGARREVRVRDAALVGAAHETIRKASSRFAKASVLYFIVTGLSLFNLLFRFGPEQTLMSTFVLARAVEGALIFPLGLWLLKSGDRTWRTLNAFMVGGAIFGIVNVTHMILSRTPRAGLTWVTNHMDWPLESPNEAGAMMVMFFALILAVHAVRPRTRHFVYLALVILLLFFTQSRSGILALLIFMAFSLRRIRVRYLLSGLGIFAAALAVMPHEFWLRMSRSLMFTRGSFEVYTFMIRVYGYVITWKIFLDHWLFGLGYLGGRYVSQDYSDLKIGNLGSENFYLETAAGSGIIGLAILALWLVRLFQLGRAVHRSTAPGTLAHEMARVHVPLMTGLAAANLFGTVLVGLIQVAQIALWCAVMVRAGHFAASKAPAPSLS